MVATVADVKFAALTSKSGKKFVPVIDPASTTEDVRKMHPSMTLVWWKPKEAGNPHPGKWTASWDKKVVVACVADGGATKAWIYKCTLTGRVESWAGLIELAARDIERKPKKSTPKAKVAPEAATDAADNSPA